MAHQCTKCGATFPDAAEELLKGCGCGSKFFYYIKQEKYDELNQLNNEDILRTISELAKADRVQVEQNIREITGLDEKPEEPVILDVESVRIIGPGKFEIDIMNLFSKKRPLIYQLEEGKYIIDLNSSVSAKKEDIDKKIRNPKPVLEQEKQREEEKRKEQERKEEEKEDIKE